MRRLINKTLMMLMMFGTSTLSACAGDKLVETEAPVQTVGSTPDNSTTEKPGSGPADKSNISSVAGVPLVELSNGVMMPQLGFGSQIQSMESDASQAGRERLNERTRQSVGMALRAGYRHIDTAHAYYNEWGVGQAIRDSGIDRSEIWITSKLEGAEYGEGITMKAIDNMLARMGVDYIDLIYLHHPVGDYVGAWHDMEKAYRQGKVRALGISNFDNDMTAFNAIIRESEIKPHIMQIEAHPYAQRINTRQLATQYNMQVEAWYPLKHADRDLLGNSTLSTIATAHGKTVAQVILKWHMQEGFAAIPGSSSEGHIKENVSIFDFELTDDEMRQIRGLDKGESGRAFNIDYSRLGSWFMTLADDYVPTGVSQARATTPGSSQTYLPSGQRTNASAKGVVIENGKKYIR